MTRFTCSAAILALAVAVPAASADDYAYTEHDFDPGTWTAMSPFWVHAPAPGTTMNVPTDRFIGGDPLNGFLVQLFSVDIPENQFNSVFAPVMMDGWGYDPSTQGAITQFAASMRTFPVAENQREHLAGVRMLIEQDGKLFTATTGDNFHAFNFDDPSHVYGFSGYVAEDFIEVVPESGLLLDSHPDFSGGPMEFGFGLSLTSTLLDGEGPLTLAGAFDDVSVRFSTVPAPAGLGLLGTGVLMMSRRRRA
ncbi:MAG: hypothetical protein ACF8R9_12160 [Phycisphaerales bacterium JB054]